MLLVAIRPIQTYATTKKEMTETLAHGYSSESAYEMPETLAHGYSSESA